jgi:hypothetical protein
MEMTKSNLVLVAAAAALTFGVMGNTATPNSPLSKSDSLIAGEEGAPSNTSTDENAEDSAKMGKEEGTHTGTNLGATPESDTSKIDQPARRNIPSNSPDDKDAPKE